MSFLFHHRSDSANSLDTMCTDEDDKNSTTSFDTLENSTCSSSVPFSKNSKNKADVETITFSFAAAGWLQVYLFGCAHALIKNVPGVRVEGLDLSYEEYLKAKASPQSSPILPNPCEEKSSSPQQEEQQQQQQQQQQQTPKFKFVGSSAGSLASAAILLGTDMKEMLEYAVGCVNHTRSKWHRAFEIRRFVEEGVSRFAINVFQRGQQRQQKRDDDDGDEARGSQEDAEIDEDPQQQQDEEEEEGALAIEPTDNTQVGFFTLVEECEPNAAVTSPTIKKNEQLPSTKATTTQAPPSATSAEQTTTTTSTTVKAAAKPSFPGDAGGWLGNEFFFPRHIRDQLKERLEVYATSLPFIQEVCFSDFESTIDLEEALVASCLLTPLAGLPFKLRRTGEWVCDGGIRSFQPRKGQPGVVTISAMYFNAADIVPSVFVPAWWGLYPPSEDQYRQLFALGFNDTLLWLWKNNIVEKPKSLEERKAQFEEYDSGKMPQKHGFFGYILDFLAAVFFLGILRPFAMVAIYAELWFVSTLCFFATVFHEFFPRTFDFLIGTKSLRNRKAGGRIETARDFWAVVRNLTSPKTMLHLALGYRNVNAKRLSKYSRLYRVFKPFVAGSSRKSEHESSSKKRHSKKE